MSLNNICIVGSPGTGKTTLLANLLMNPELSVEKLLVFGKIEGFGITQEEFCAVAKSAFHHTHSTDDRDSLYDEKLYLDFVGTQSEGNTLVVIDDDVHISERLAATISKDMAEGKIRLWIASRRLSDFYKIWNIAALDDFHEFYFFRSESEESFIAPEIGEQIAALEAHQFLHFSPESAFGPFKTGNFKAQYPNFEIKQMDDWVLKNIVPEIERNLTFFGYLKQLLYFSLVDFSKSEIERHVVRINRFDELSEDVKDKFPHQAIRAYFHNVKNRADDLGWRRGMIPQILLAILPLTFLIIILGKFSKISQTFGFVIFGCLLLCGVFGIISFILIGYKHTKARDMVEIIKKARDE